MQKRWSLQTIQDKVEFLEFKRNLDALCEQTKKPFFPVVVLQLLFQRGIDSIEKANQFFKPSWEHLHNPFLMKDMEKAIQRIEKAIQNKEKVLVYGDYDVDGTTSVAMVYSFFKTYHPLIAFYIPDRYKEGYGISNAGVDFAKRENFGLIIALDCGIKSVDKIQYAHTLGIDFIICDHHLPGDEVPNAVAVLDAKQKDCDYPYKELSGCGVGFKLIQAFAQKNGIAVEEVTQYVDLVAVSIAADIVPITGENRTLAYFGLKKLNTNPSMGFKTMMQGQKKKENYTITDVVFLLAPRINAAGRMDDACNAVKLLIAHTDSKAQEHSDWVEIKNTERRGFDSSITEEALLLLDDEKLKTQKTTVVYHPEWHKGVVGIVASRLTETYYRPTVVLTQSNGLLTGSARSVAGFDLYAALKNCEHLLEQFGGHQFAAGLTLKEENLDAFKHCFEKTVSDTIPQELLTPEIVIDAELDLENINQRLYQMVQLFAPFGPSNMNPVFLTKGIYAKATFVGKNHLKLQFDLPNGTILEGIAFGFGNLYDFINTQQRIDICYHIDENVWRDKKTLQLQIKDIRID